MIPWFEVIAIEIPVVGIPLHGFGLFVALGFIFGSRAAIGRADRMGLDGDAINRLVTWLVVGTFVGGHVGYGLMYKFDEYMADPIQFLYVWQGLSSFGGFIVCIPLAIWFFVREKLPVWTYLDCLAYGMAIGWFLGRMGCFVAHDHPGSETDFFLGVWCRPTEGHLLDLPNWLVLGAGEPNMPWGPCAKDSSIDVVHDTGLYEALWSLAMFGVLTLMDRRSWKPGILVLVFGLAYGPFRFMTDSLRPEYSDPTTFGLTPAQYGAAAFALTCITLLVMRLQSDDEAVGPPATEAPDKTPDKAPAESA